MYFRRAITTLGEVKINTESRGKQRVKMRIGCGQVTHPGNLRRAAVIGLGNWKNTHYFQGKCANFGSIMSRMVNI